MSGNQGGINAVDQILQKVDLAGIQDERARECIRLLLNLIESLTADLRKAHAEILYLREQLNRRKGGGGKPDRSKTVRQRHHIPRKKNGRSLRKRNRTPSAASWTGCGSTGKKC